MNNSNSCTVIVESSSQNGGEDRNYCAEYMGANAPFDRYSWVDGYLDATMSRLEVCGELEVEYTVGRDRTSADSAEK